MSIDVRRSGTLSDRVAAEIRAEMARQQISGRTLARKLGRSPNWVSLKVSGSQQLDLNDLAQIADALGVTVVDLFPRSDRQVTVTYPEQGVRPESGDTSAHRPISRRPPNRAAGRTPPTGPGRTSPVRPRVAA